MIGQKLLINDLFSYFFTQFWRYFIFFFYVFFLKNEEIFDISKYKLCFQIYLYLVKWMFIKKGNLNQLSI